MAFNVKDIAAPVKRCSAFLDERAINLVVAEGQPSTKSFSKDWRTLWPMKGPFSGGASTPKHGVALQTLRSWHELVAKQGMFQQRSERDNYM